MVWMEIKVEIEEEVSTSLHSANLLYASSLKGTGGFL